MDSIVKCARHNTVRDATKEPCWGCEREREREAGEHAVRVENGKYTFVKSIHVGSIQILRYGEEWHEQQDAFNALSTIMAELDAARVVVDMARRLVESGEAPMALRDALKTHEALVSDNEKPSGWAQS